MVADARRLSRLLEERRVPSRARLPPLTRRSLRFSVAAQLQFVTELESHLGDEEALRRALAPMVTVCLGVAQTGSPSRGRRPAAR